MRKTRALKTTTRIYLQDKNVWTDYIKFLSSGSKGGNAIHRENLYPVHSTLDFPKKFDQSEHDTRIWYHGTAASKACLQVPPPFPPHRDTARLASPAVISVSYWTPFFALFRHCGAWSQASWIVLAIF